MVTREAIIGLIRQNSTKPYDHAPYREIVNSDIEAISATIEKSVRKSEEEWEELSTLKAQNAVLKAENDVYRNFLLSSGYKLPKERSTKKNENH